MKAPGGGGRLKPLFGSSDQRLMRKCPCPVWIVKPSRKKYFRKILAAVDLNPSEPDTEALARQIMSLATWLAKEERSELHVLHVWRLPGEAKLRGRQILTTSADKILRDLRAAHKTELDGLLKHYPYEKKIVHLIKGRAGEVIPAFAEKHEVDLVVIGTVARGGIPGLFIGNTAEKVLSEVDCSVLTLKPEGFETPIKV
jgi:nucleotide-binding universal stress UspA family protein